MEDLQQFRRLKKKGSPGDAELARVEGFDPETFPFHVQTMERKTYERETGQGRPVALRKSTDLEWGRTWVFTDGSGTRWYAAILIRPNVDVHRISTQCQEGSNNAAEIAGVNLGLAHSPPGIPVTIVSDQMWSAYYVLGWRVAHQPYLIAAVRQARALLVERSLPDVTFVHIKGHQGQKNAFTWWNEEADRLCSAREEIDIIEPLAK